MRLTVSEEAIKEIAELLDCGFVCYYHRTTGAIESLPGWPDDEKIWAETTDKIDADITEYIRFEPPDSSESYRFMENFIMDEVVNRRIQIRLLESIERKKPFQHFKVALEYYPELRQQWFAYRAQCLQRYVQDEVDDPQRSFSPPAWLPAELAVYADHWLSTASAHLKYSDGAFSRFGGKFTNFHTHFGGNF